MNLAFWVLQHLWIELALALFAIGSIYLSFQTSQVVRLKPLNLPSSPGAVPLNETRTDQELRALGFLWIGDFDASSVPNLTTLVRFHSSVDFVHHAVLITVQSSVEKSTMVEFSTELVPGGSVTTNNNRQPGIYRYRLEKLVVRAPWKGSIRDLFTLHQLLCEAAVASGFALRPIPPHLLVDHITTDSRMDIEGELKLGRMRRIDPDTYRTTLKGAVTYVPRIWFKMIHGFLFDWYRVSDHTQIQRARQRFVKAARGLH